MSAGCLLLKVKFVTMNIMSMNSNDEQQLKFCLLFGKICYILFPSKDSKQCSDVSVRKIHEIKQTDLGPALRAI